MSNPGDISERVATVLGNMQLTILNQQARIEHLEAQLAAVKSDDEKKPRAVEKKVS